MVQHVWAPIDRITVVPNGVPVGEFHPPTQEERLVARRAADVPVDAFAVLCIGALAKEKGVDLAIESVASVEGALLLIAGDGPEREGLERLARARGVDRVRFLGPLERPFEGYAACVTSLCCRARGRQHAGDADRGRILCATDCRNTCRFDRDDRPRWSNGNDRARGEFRCARGRARPTPR